MFWGVPERHIPGGTSRCSWRCLGWGNPLAVPTALPGASDPPGNLRLGRAGDCHTCHTVPCPPLGKMDIRGCNSALEPCTGRECPGNESGISCAPPQPLPAQKAAWPRPGGPHLGAGAGAEPTRAWGGFWRLRVLQEI